MNNAANKKQIIVKALQGTLPKSKYVLEFFYQYPEDLKQHLLNSKSKKEYEETHKVKLFGFNKSLDFKSNDQGNCINEAIGLMTKRTIEKNGRCISLVLSRPVPIFVREAKEYIMNQSGYKSNSDNSDVVTLLNRLGALIKYA